VQELDEKTEGGRRVSGDSPSRKRSKSWLGDKFQVVFIDTDEKERLERSLVQPEELARNDKTKLGRGAMDIRSYADVVLDNNGLLSESIASLMLFSEVGAWHWNVLGWETVRPRFSGKEWSISKN
jgi:hypothetical protein